MSEQRERPGFILCRRDGQGFYGEYAFFTASGPDDFDAADECLPEEAADRGVPIDALILRVDPTPVARRRYYPSGTWKVV